MTIYFDKVLAIIYEAKYLCRDLFAYMIAYLRRENYVGRNIHILPKREVKYFFDGDEICGGFTYGFPNIQLFMGKEYVGKENCINNPEDVTADFINHEVLHQVLHLRISYKAFQDLDNIHFCLWHPQLHCEFVKSGKWDKSKIHGGLL